MKIECFLSPGCASEDALRKNLEAALALEGVEALVAFKRITPEEAGRLGLVGSPSIFVNGREVLKPETVSSGFA